MDNVPSTSGYAPKRQQGQEAPYQGGDWDSSTDTTYSDTDYIPLESRHCHSKQAKPSTSGQLAELASLVTGLAKTMHQRESTRTASAPQHSQAFRGDAVPPFVPEDANQDVNRWLRQVDELQYIYKWTEEATIYYALGKLRGLAATWYQGLPSIKFTWAEWKAKLAQAFPFQKDYCTQLEGMLRRKKRPDETMVRYFYEKNAMVSACQIQGTNAVSCIIGGIIDEHIQTIARAGNHANPESLFNFLRTCTERRSHKAWSGKTNERTWTDRKHRPQHGPPAGRTKCEVRCYRCNMNGHVARHCRNQRKEAISVQAEKREDQQKP